MPQLERLGLGDHICWTVDDEVVRRRTLSEVALSGFRARHRVVWCGADPGDVPAAVGEALASGDLQLPPARSSGLGAGLFDPAKAVSFLRREIDEARRADYAGLRLLADLSWAGRPEADGLAEYEARAGAIFAEGYALAVCAYDPRRFDPATLWAVTQAHLGTVAADEPFDPAAALRIRRTWQPFGLSLAGEADLMNRVALEAVLDHLLEDLPGGTATVTVDLSALRFIDTAAARVLLLASQRAAGRLRFLGCPAALSPLFDSYGVA